MDVYDLITRRGILCSNLSRQSSDEQSRAAHRRQRWHREATRWRHGRGRQRCPSTCYRPQFSMRFGPAALQRRGELIFTHLSSQQRQWRVHDGGVACSSFGGVRGALHWFSGAGMGTSGGGVTSSCSVSGRGASERLVAARQW
jgi:hypothetical protein